MHPPVAAQVDEWTEGRVSSTGDRTAVGGSCPIHAPVPGSKRSARGGWEAMGAMGAIPPPRAAQQPEPTSGLVGYRGPTACAAAGITYRQLDYWARTGLVEPSVRAAEGTAGGGHRLYAFRDILVLKVVKRLLDAGVSLQSIRAAVGHLGSCDPADLSGVTLMSDGATVYECTSSRQVVELLAGGQGVFGIALGAVWRELDTSLRALHGERTDTGETLIGYDPRDELARRRNRAV
jgi:DNA-binding transcriptional MerR regulator